MPNTNVKQTKKKGRFISVLINNEFINTGCKAKILNTGNSPNHPPHRPPNAKKKLSEACPYNAQFLTKPSERNGSSLKQK